MKTLALKGRLIFKAIKIMRTKTTRCKRYILRMIFKINAGKS